MKEALLIYNPHPGKDSLPGSLSPVLDVFTKAGWLVTVYPTSARGTLSEPPKSWVPVSNGWYVPAAMAL